MAADKTPVDVQRRIQRAMNVPGAKYKTIAKLLGVGVQTVVKFSNPPYFTRRIWNDGNDSEETAGEAQGPREAPGIDAGTEDRATPEDPGAAIGAGRLANGSGCGGAAPAA